MERRDIRLGAVGSWADQAEAADAFHFMHGQGGCYQGKQEAYLPGLVIAGQYWTETIRHPPLSRWPLAPSPWVLGASTSSASASASRPIGDPSVSVPSREIWRLHRRSRDDYDSQTSPFSSPIRHSPPSKALYPLPPMPSNLSSTSNQDPTRTPATPPRRSPTAMTTPDSASSNRSSRPVHSHPAHPEDFEADLIDLSARMMKGFVYRVSRFSLLLAFKLWAAEARSSRPMRSRAKSLRSDRLLYISFYSLLDNVERNDRSRRMKEVAQQFLSDSTTARLKLALQSWHSIASQSLKKAHHHNQARDMKMKRAILIEWNLWADRRAYLRCISEELQGEYCLKLLVSVFHCWHHQTQLDLQWRGNTLVSHLQALNSKLMKKIWIVLREKSKESIVLAEAASISVAQFLTTRIIRSWHKLAETRRHLQEAERLIEDKATELRSEHCLFAWRTSLIERQRVMLVRGLKMRRCLQHWLVLAKKRSAILSEKSVEVKIRLETLLCILVLRCWKEVIWKKTAYESDPSRRRMRELEWPLMCRCFHSWRAVAISRRISYPSLLSSPLLVSSTQTLPHNPTSRNKISGLLDHLTSKSPRGDDPFRQLSSTLRKGQVGSRHTRNH